jgi:hypothetical protein
LAIGHDSQGYAAGRVENSGGGNGCPFAAYQRTRAIAQDQQLPAGQADRQFDDGADKTAGEKGVDILPRLQFVFVKMLFFNHHPTQGLTDAFVIGIVSSTGG